MKRVSEFILVGLCVILTALPVSAQGQFCAAREKMVQWLAITHSQGRRAEAIDAAGQLVEIFTNLENGAWTLTVTVPDGVSCVLGQGDAFELVQPEGIEG